MSLSYQNNNMSYQKPTHQNTSYQNSNMSYQNSNMSYQNPTHQNMSYQNSNMSYQKPTHQNMSYQNSDMSYQNPTYQNSDMSYQNDDASIQNDKKIIKTPEKINTMMNIFYFITFLIPSGLIIAFLYSSDTLFRVKDKDTGEVTQHLVKYAFYSLIGVLLTAFIVYYHNSWFLSGKRTVNGFTIFMYLIVALLLSGSVFAAFASYSSTVLVLIALTFIILGINNTIFIDKTLGYNPISYGIFAITAGFIYGLDDFI